MASEQDRVVLGQESAMTDRLVVGQGLERSRADVELVGKHTLTVNEDKISAAPNFVINIILALLWLK